MRTLRLYLISLFTILCTTLTVAQEVIVNVTPVQNILPPQVLLYVSDPGRYFNISLVNTTSETQNVYLALSLHQSVPASGLGVVTPDDCQPSTPFSIPAKGTKTLTPMEMKTLFNHVPSNRVKATEGLFDDYMSGAFGLLPEGDYEAQIRAYKWSNPRLQTPVLVSNPHAGKTYFTVCYRAQAPQFLLPMPQGGFDDGTTPANLEALNPMFTWTAPVLTCNQSATQYRYDFRVVEVLANQSPDEAIERNPVVYQAKNLLIPQASIPTNIIKSQFNTNKTYVAQVTASATNASVLSYVMIENDGKSTYKLFRIKTNDVQKNNDNDNNKKQNDNDNNNKQNNNNNNNKNDDDDINIVVGDVELSSFLDPSADYTYSLPRITSPVFSSGDENGARKMFIGGDIKVEWTSSYHMGGEGQNTDTLGIAYEVELFSGGQTFDREAAMSNPAIYYNKLTECEDSIPWETIESFVEKGDYLVLRVNPVLTKGSSVTFAGEETNIRDFALCEMLSKKYFQCSNSVEIDNTTPTSKNPSEFIGKTVHIGEYELTISEMRKGKNGFEGKGHVLWQPLGFDINVCVKFTDLEINTDDIVISGVAQTYSNDEQQSNIQVVDKLFSDWGIDNLIGDTGIPYANELQASATNKVRSLAEKIDLSKYYGYVKKGNAIYNSFLTGGIQDLYMPLSIPKSINKSPVDIQIVGMKFAATYATMDILGEFTLPNTSYTKNEILVLGAPRICISPDRILPESGTIALLSDFTINDPKSSYELTFNAPDDLLKPTNGCFVSWHDDAFEMLGIDVDMKIPGLVKDINGQPSNERPVFNVHTTIAEWDDWEASVTIDPFQVSALPGWSFTASNVIYDHSLFRNNSNMGAFPDNYNKSKAGITNVVKDGQGKVWEAKGDDSWQGLYIKDIAIKFPKSLEFGENSDKRLEVSAQNMFFDKSGATLDVKAANLISAKTGSAGGWGFSLDKVFLSFLQSDFSNCGFSGTFDVPLIDSAIDYDCKIYKLASNAQSAGQYAYVFKVQQIKDINLDFWLAKAKVRKDHSYFLLESIPKNGQQDTSVELMLGGDVTLGGADYIQNVAKQKLNMNFELPGVHFAGMRISNKSQKTWTATYEKDLQSKARNATIEGKKFYTGEEMQFGSCYFNPGSWSVASAQKKLGGFDLSVENYTFKKQGNDQVDLEVTGSIGLVSGVTIKAKTSFVVSANVSLPKSLTDIKNIKLSYKGTQFKDANIHAEFADMVIDGSLAVSNDSEKEGFSGSLTFKMPGDLFSVNADGGYYKVKNEDYTYGWFYCKAAGSVGIQAPPIVINGITGGFYYNCKKSGDKGATPVNGLIGVIAGLKLSTTAGESALSADLDMTVVYDKKNKRLSSMIFNGDVQALDGVVNANCNIVYENSGKDRYLELDVTVDASVDNSSVSKDLLGTSETLTELKQKLNSNYEELVKNTPLGSLSGAFDDVEGTPDARKAKKGSKEELSTSPIEVSIPINLKITWKEAGKTYSPVHWHLYVGKPSLNDRCKITLLKFKSKIVSIDLGANAYLCIGNELPDGGKLPDIPTEISEFLNGGGDSKGIESANLSQANAARKASLNEFNEKATANGGGVMFGAQAYGYFNVDLGLFYLNTGVTAGFDLSLVKLGNNAKCVNTGALPGYKGWYGYGQLYAYLYAAFGIKLDLGFWEGKVDFADAGIGGLFQFQGPKPTHFEGKARVKLKLFNGLVDIDRRFAFECGEGCDVFAGNALDEFKLFGDLSIGYDNMDQGWNDKNKIDPKLIEKPYYITEAPLEEHFRVLDETELARLKNNFEGGDPSGLEMEASRTFVFHSNVKSSVTIYEYKTKNDKNPTKRTFYLGAKNRFINYINLTQLNPNRYYKMELTGYAKEIINATEHNPAKWDDKRGWHLEPWTTSKTYYFCTGPNKDIPNVPDLQNYIAIAYPSYYNQINSEQPIKAHENDVKFPNFALTTDISKKCFQDKGQLYWRLYSDDKDLSNPSTHMSYLGQVRAAFATTNNTCNIVASTTKDKGLGGYTLNKTYRLALVYETSTELPNGSIRYSSQILANMRVIPMQTHWKTGYTEARQTVNTIYEKPFIGSRIDKVWYENEPQRISDYELACGTGTVGKTKKLHRLYNPYYYIGYLSNYAFVGGWDYENARIDSRITACQSLVYTDKGGVYEGKLAGGTTDSYNAYNDYTKIRNLSIFDKNQWSKFCPYPLPDLNDPKYGYTLNGLSRVPVFEPSKKYYRNVQGYISDMYTPNILVWHFQDNIKRLLTDILSKTSTYFRKVGKDGEGTRFINYLRDWYVARRGAYSTRTFNGATLQVPMYQYPIIVGSCLNPDNTEGRAAENMLLWNCLIGYCPNWSNPKNFNHARGHENNSEYIIYNLVGKNVADEDGRLIMNFTNLSHDRDDYKLNTTHITDVDFSIYRVNGYNFNTCQYTVIENFYGEPCIESFELSDPLTYYNKQ